MVLQCYRQHESSSRRYLNVQEESCSDESTSDDESEKDTDQSEEESEVEEFIPSHGHCLPSSAAQSSCYNHARKYDLWHSTNKASQMHANFKPELGYCEEHFYHGFHHEPPLYNGEPKVESFNQERGHEAYDYQMYKSAFNSCTSNDHQDCVSNKLGSSNEINYHMSFNDKAHTAHDHRNSTSMTSSSSLQENLEQEKANKFTSYNCLDNHQTKLYSLASNSTSMTPSSLQGNLERDKANGFTSCKCHENFHQIEPYSLASRSTFKTSSSLHENLEQKKANKFTRCKSPRNYQQMKPYSSTFKRSTMTTSLQDKKNGSGFNYHTSNHKEKANGTSLDSNH